MHLDDTTATILLANSNAQILDRWASRSFLRTLDRFSVAPGFVFAEHLVGTNGLGCALEEKRLFEVHGPNTSAIASATWSASQPRSSTPRPESPTVH